MSTEWQPDHLSIKSWAEDDRPREKLAKHGQKSLSDAELLAIVIGSGMETHRGRAFQTNIASFRSTVKCALEKIPVGLAKI